MSGTTDLSIKTRYGRKMIPLFDNLQLRRTPVLTVVLVVLNVAIFIGWQGGSTFSNEKIVLYGAVPYELTHPGNQCAPVGGAFACGPESEAEAHFGREFPSSWVTVFTHMFMHAGWLHLIGNMLVLLALGRALEDALGSFSFALFYLVGGFGAVAGHALIEPGAGVPMIGASGAIASVMAGYLMLFPRAKLLTLLIVIPLHIRAFWVIGFWLFEQVVSAYFSYSSQGAGVAYFAHFGGFVAGLALVRLVVSGEILEQQRRRARIASGDESPYDETTVLIPFDGVASTATSQALSVPGTSSSTIPDGLLDRPIT